MQDGSDVTSDSEVTSSGFNAAVGHIIIEEETHRAEGSLELVGTKQQGGGGGKQQGRDVEGGSPLALQRSGSSGGLTLPFKPMSVAFKNVSYFVPHPGVSGGDSSHLKYW